MKKLINWILFNRNGQTILIITIALYIAGLLQNW
jgi:hypothetical protein